MKDPHLLLSSAETPIFRGRRRTYPPPPPPPPPSSSPPPSFRLILFLFVAAFLLGALPILLQLSGLLSLSSSSCPLQHSHPFPSLMGGTTSFHGDLRLLPSSWNQLLFPATTTPPPISLRIALFVKKWPFTLSPGGLERHALTLHHILANRGHQVHVFTTDGVSANLREPVDGNLHFHICPPNDHGVFNIVNVWETFLEVHNSEPFDIVHSESVALPPVKAKEIRDVPTVVSWHGIAYEVIHSDIVRELNRMEGEARASDLQRALNEQILRVVEEVRFFSSYAHHVAISDYVGDVLRTIYQIPLMNVHIILNGVDEQRFHPNAAAAGRFRAAWKIPPSALVLGAAGRLVRDKGYPLLYDAFPILLKKHPSTYLLIAGDGPWAVRFKALSPSNVVVLGPLSVTQLAEFYNAIDIFINPTQRAQGLDTTLLEAMLCGKPLLATHFSSITRSVIVSEEMGYTFSPNVPALTEAMRQAVEDGRTVLRRKGEACYQRASLLFTATKMASAYERLFLCIKDASFCMYV